MNAMMVFAKPCGNQLALLSIARNGMPACQQRLLSSHAVTVHEPDYKRFIGKREIVGFGSNGEPNYIDYYQRPFPAIRFKPDTPEIAKLRVKEKGDWRQMSLDEKKELYRASFRQTFAEFEYAPNGEWKLNIAVTLIGFGVVFCWYIFLDKYVFPPLPESFSEENKEKTMAYLIRAHANPVEGIGSMWDYEKGRWK